ncbi:peptidase [Paenibacillus athensensis]|uniref:Peptidase n=1 Tax=Paenibacillus athensensis TaxID=1967502 RepID=A0A4Y8PSW1_9BACL|nr:DUF1796 family putative cysteine peptidase [Paenibacillus athensensis]MCD1258091.1 peptidase [Paenibacillus athensensis]
MRIRELNGAYDGIFSIGFNCLPAIQLEKNGLRPFAGVIDWMYSDMTNVSRLFAHRFAGFMSRGNLAVVGFDYAQVNLLVEDRAYGITSTHDFPSSRNSLYALTSYPEFRDKMDRRIERCLERFDNGKRLLFVRTGGTYEQAVELERVLRQVVRHEFSLLLVNFSEVWNVVDIDWPLEHVCSVLLPKTNIWTDWDHLWSKLLRGIHYRQMIG